MAKLAFSFWKFFKSKLREFNLWLDEDGVETVVRELLERTRYNIEVIKKVLSYCRGPGANI